MIFRDLKIIDSMKNILLGIAVMSTCVHSSAQGLSNFFSQKEAQIKYMVQQIAALQVYISDAEKGYQIVEKGLSAIGDIKRTDLSMHQDYFGSLSKVNPTIAGSADVSAMADLEDRINEAVRLHLSRIRQSGQFTSGELGYIQTVFDRVTAGAHDDMNQLSLLLTAGNYQFSDDERMARIVSLGKDMQDKYEFTQAFGKQAEMLALSRLRDQNSVQALQSLYDLKNP
jgi:hypothetical protein